MTACEPWSHIEEISQTTTTKEYPQAVRFAGCLQDGLVDHGALLLANGWKYVSQFPLETVRELVQVGEVKLRMSVLDGDGDDEEHHVIIICKRRIVFASAVDGFVPESPLELVLSDVVSSQCALEGLVFNVPAHCPSLKDAETEYFGVSQDCQIDVNVLCV